MTFAHRAAFALVLLVPGLAAKADGPKSPATDPEAKKALDGLIAAYKALPAYSDQGSVTLEVKLGDATRTETQKAKITFARPNKIDVETDLVRLVSDGTTATAAVVPLKKYLAGPAPEKFAESSFRNGPLGAIEFGGVAGLPLVHVLNLVVGQEPDRLIYDFAPRVVVEPDREIEGKTYRSLRLDEADNFDWRFLIDPQTGLLAFIDLAVDQGPGNHSGGGFPGAKIERLRWAAGTISTEPPPADRFAFKAPEGFAAVAKLSDIAAAEAKGEGKPDEASPLVGKAAPDFTLDVLDGPGKYRKVSKADLKGKVVLIDFWATWCGPCLAELPDIQRLIDDYARANKDVVVVALSIDQAEAGDLDEARALVEKTLKAKDLTLSGNPVGLVAIDPLGIIAKAYEVEAIPFVVLVDGSGTVRAVHVGVTRREVFAEQIDALLAGKSPVKPKAEEK